MQHHREMHVERSSELLLEALRRQFDVEEGRAQSLNARGVGLAGFGSVILSLLTLSVSNEFGGDRVVALPYPARVMLVAALGFLVVAVAVIVLGVMAPKPARDFSAAELYELRERDAHAVRERLLVRLVDAVESQREINDSKARFLNGAALAVTVAVGLSAVAGTLIALD